MTGGLLFAAVALIPYIVAFVVTAFFSPMHRFFPLHSALKWTCLLAPPNFLTGCFMGAAIYRMATGLKRASSWPVWLWVMLYFVALGPFVLSVYMAYAHRRKVLEKNKPLWVVPCAATTLLILLAILAARWASDGYLVLATIIVPFVADTWLVNQIINCRSSLKSAEEKQPRFQFSLGTLLLGVVAFAVFALGLKL